MIESATSTTNRLSTGIAELDAHLGGGLLPGTLTVVIGATGIGKTQLGVSFAHAGRQQENRPGVFFDMTSRGDSQSHAEYARRLFGWELARTSGEQKVNLENFFDPDREHGDYLHIFDHSGRRVTRGDLDFDQFQKWHQELAAKLEVAIAFLYGNLVQGTRRVVIDGIEPVGRPSDSIQLELFEYVYHQILRKEPEWVARDLFRQHFRAQADAVAAHPYNPADVGCLLLYTSAEPMLEQLIERPLDEGDLLSGANTVIYLGKIREGMKFGRAVYIAKHRGSACAEELLPYRITESGIELI